MRAEPKKIVFPSFTFDTWGTSTQFELISLFIQSGADVEWLDWAGLFRREFEFPISDRMHYARIRRNKKIVAPFTSHNFRINRGQPRNYARKSNLSVDGKVIDISREVAYLELISRNRESEPCQVHNLQKLRDFAQTFEDTYYEFRRFALSSKIDEVYLYNGRFLQERAVWEACKDLNIPTKFYEKFNPTWTNRFFVFHKPVHSPSYRSKLMLDFAIENHFESKNELIRDAEKWFIDRISGQSQNFTSKQRLGENLDQFGNYFVFFHSSEDELITTDLKAKSWQNQFDTIESLVNLIIERGAENLVIRLHPNLLNKSLSEISKWKAFSLRMVSRSKLVFIVWPESSISSYDLISASQAVLTAGSTIGVEAIFLGKKSILLGRAFHEEMNVVTKCESIDQLRKELDLNQQHDQSQKFINALKYGYFHLRAGTPFIFTRFIHERGKDSYYFNDILLNRSLPNLLLMRIDSSMSKIRARVGNRLRGCNSDCWTHSSARWQ